MLYRKCKLLDWCGTGNIVAEGWMVYKWPKSSCSLCFRWSSSSKSLDTLSNKTWCLLVEAKFINDIRWKCNRQYNCVAIRQKNEYVYLAIDYFISLFLYFNKLNFVPIVGWCRVIYVCNNLSENTTKLELFWISYIDIFCNL